jgi:hypothetical protein
MSWAAITEADLLTQISGDELASIRAAALGAGQADPVQPTIDQVTAYVRGRVAACQQNSLGAGNTIPDELLMHAVAMIVVGLIKRPAGMVIESEDVRQKAADRAEEVLKDVAACEVAIEQPEEVSDEEIASPSPSISGNDRTMTRTTMDGL